jgi:hypothetical protein
MTDRNASPSPTPTDETPKVEIRLTLCNRAGELVTADCEITRIVALNSGGCRIEVERPGPGDGFDRAAVTTDSRGRILPEPEGVVALW